MKILQQKQDVSQTDEEEEVKKKNIARKKIAKDWSQYETGDLSSEEENHLVPMPPPLRSDIPTTSRAATSNHVQPTMNSSACTCRCCAEMKGQLK